MTDHYYTIAAQHHTQCKEKMSRFISYAFPVHDETEIKEHLTELQSKYYDARHICWAYVLGHERNVFRSNDNGEPSGTAGKPILGQINSFGITNVLVAVVRYFGGIKLGTGGLISAYKESARLVLSECDIVERIVREEVTVKFEYPQLNEVMKIIKDESLEIAHQTLELDCEYVVLVRLNDVERIRERFRQTINGY